MTISEKMKLWNISTPAEAHAEAKTPGSHGQPSYDTSVEAQVRQDSDDSNAGENETWESEETSSTLPDIPLYRELIRGSVAYTWLVRSFRRELLVTGDAADAMGHIRRKLTDALPASNPISRSRPSQVYVCVFAAEWDPVGFIQDQEYKHGLKALAGALALTENADQHVQALSTAGYMNQTWPSSGVDLLRMIQELLGREPGERLSCELYVSHFRCSVILIQARSHFGKWDASYNVHPWITFVSRGIRAQASHHRVGRAARMDHICPPIGRGWQ